MAVLIFGGGGIATGIKETLESPVIVVDKTQCDVKNYSTIESVINEYNPTVVINCAGISFPQAVIGSGLFEWREEIEVNLLGSYHVATACMNLNPDIVMVFIASVAGKYGKPEHSGYSASKAGVISLVQSLGMEGHRAYAISPGRVDTPMREKDYPGEDPRTRLTTEQVAGVVQGIIDGVYNPGGNIIIRKIGYDTFIGVDGGEPWKEKLNVGKPKTF